MSCKVINDRLLMIYYPQSELPDVTHKFITNTKSDHIVGSYYMGDGVDKDKVLEFFHNFNDEYENIDLYMETGMFEIYKEDMERNIFEHHYLFKDDLNDFKQYIDSFIDPINDNVLISKCYPTQSLKYLKIDNARIDLNLSKVLYEDISCIVIKRTSNNKYFIYPMLRSDFQKSLNKVLLSIDNKNNESL